MVSGMAFGDVVDFEEIKALSDVPLTPFVSGGLLFEAGLADAVFPPNFTPGANNGTQFFGWCGSNCSGDGSAQIISVSQAEEGLFDLLSIDAGNLLPFGAGPGEWVSGMTVEIEGFFDDGSSVSQSLFIEENVFGTYVLEGFTDLDRVEISAPPVLLEGGAGNPDAVFDNLVWNPSGNAIPEPATTTIASMLLIGCLVRRRR